MSFLVRETPGRLRIRFFFLMFAFLSHFTITGAFLFFSLRRPFGQTIIASYLNNSLRAAFNTASSCSITSLLITALLWCPLHSHHIEHALANCLRIPPGNWGLIALLVVKKALYQIVVLRDYSWSSMEQSNFQFVVATHQNNCGPMDRSTFEQIRTSFRIHLSSVCRVSRLCC